MSKKCQKEYFSLFFFLASLCLWFGTGNDLPSYVKGIYELRLVVIHHPRMQRCMQSQANLDYWNLLGKNGFCDVME